MSLRAEHYCAIGSGVSITVALTAWLFIPHETTAKVASINWTYQSDLRQKTLMHDSGWGTRSGAFNVYCRRKYYGEEDCNYYQCNPHTIWRSCNCNKDGCDRCSRIEYDRCHHHCDVYRDWCEYDYYNWPIIQTLETTGSRHNEYWPNLQPNGPDQRLDRKERYQVLFVGKTEWTYAPRNLPEFQQFETDTLWKIKVNNLKMVTPLQLLHPEAPYGR